MLIADDLDKLLEILPVSIKNSLKKYNNKKLLEIVMDLGRRPEARFPDKPYCLSRKVVSWQDLDYCIKRIAHFSGDNRSGIEKTLHRISSIRNRSGNIIGLTCRVGRALFGTISIIRDLLDKQRSILILGKPGIGKTTAIREICRILADEMQKRVIVIDTSNEIAGDGDIPHPAIGRARRMQVALPEFQHQVMIEAVENHMPQVIVIDEISTELEVLAARTISERGVQLIGTVHGHFLGNLIKNPTMCDLVGGIQYVTLGDDEAKRRGTQKSILERKATPAFQVAIEIHEYQNWIIHEKLDITIDQMLQGYYTVVQCRKVLSRSKVTIYSKSFFDGNFNKHLMSFNELNKKFTHNTSQHLDNAKYPMSQLCSSKEFPIAEAKSSSSSDLLSRKVNTIKLYIYLMSYFEINEVIKTLKMPIVICKSIYDADAILALRFHVKQNTQLRKVAKTRKIMVYIIHSSTHPQIARALKRILNSQIIRSIDWRKLFQSKNSEEKEALHETKLAIENFVLAKKQPVQLLPRNQSIRMMQKQLINLYNLKARIFADGSKRCLRIYLT